MLRCSKPKPTLDEGPEARGTTAGLLAGWAAQRPAALLPPPAPASPGGAAKAVLLRLFLQSLPHMDKLPKAVLRCFLLQPLPHLEELPKAVLLHLLLQSMPCCSASSYAPCPSCPRPFSLTQN